MCQKILNLDDETRECPACKAAFHPDCMRQQLDLKCVSCKEEIPRKLVYTHKREQVIAQEEPPAKKRQKIAGVESGGENVNQTLNQRVDQKQVRVPYLSLKDDAELSGELEKFITEVKLKNEKAS